MNTRRLSPAVLILAAFMVMLVPVSGQAEDVDAEFEAGHWGNEATLGINMLQSYYTENWNGGDKGSVVWNGTFDARAKKKLSERWHWFNTMNLAYGQNHQQERNSDGELYWKKPDKTDDQIKLETLLRYTNTGWDPFIGARFESRFLDQTDPREDFTLNPLEFFETIGISRMFVETEEKRFLMRFGFTFHQMIRDINTDSVESEDDPDVMVYETFNEKGGDGGLELVLNYVDKMILDRVEYNTQLRFYQPVYYTGQNDLDSLNDDQWVLHDLPTDLADYTTTLDIDWENTFKANITSVINVQLHVRWVYDKYDNSVKPLAIDGELVNASAVKGSIRKVGQVKQTMSIGLGYTF